MIKIKLIILLIATLCIFFGIALSINAKDLNMLKKADLIDTSTPPGLSFSHSSFYLIGVGIVGFALIARRESSQDPSPRYINGYKPEVDDAE
jgi:hypothetical protein